MKPANPIYYTATARPFRVTVPDADHDALRFWTRWVFISVLMLMMGSAGHVYAQTPQEAPRNALTQLRHVSLPGDRLQVVLDFEQALIAEPGSFSIENPARLAFDFVATRNSLSTRTHPVNVGLVQSVNAVEADGRTRVVLHLTHMMRYETRIDNQQFTILLTPRESTASRDRPIQPLIADQVVTEEEPIPMPEAVPVPPPPTVVAPGYAPPPYLHWPTKLSVPPCGRCAKYVPWR
ncbi:AMIN domain-containing protein [Thiorhodospira sibirica]|uniref:AMIN domain-containing protein n=1 Tax=Thiorhodospira sibirica TaxID=154347 RepID=UPI00022C112D|nr:AMIN domain-containing protein [Thiorhodospira sibirica]